MFNGSTIKKKIATKYMKKNIYLNFFSRNGRHGLNFPPKITKVDEKKAVNEFKKSGGKTRLANSKGVM